MTLLCNFTFNNCQFHYAVTIDNILSFVGLSNIPSISGQTGYLYFLTVVIILQWSWVCKFPFDRWISFFLGIYPEVVCLDDTSVVFYLFEQPPFCFHNDCTNEHSHMPLTMHKGSLFSTFLPTLVIFWLFDKSQFYWSELISHYGFELYFLDDYWCWTFFFHIHSNYHEAYKKNLFGCLFALSFYSGMTT